MNEDEFRPDMDDIDIQVCCDWKENSVIIQMGDKQTDLEPMEAIKLAYFLIEKAANIIDHGTVDDTGESF